MKILVLNGPNLDRLGTRQPEIYGTTTLADVEASLTARARDRGVTLECMQTADLEDALAAIAATDADAIIMNPASWTHTAMRLREAIGACDIPVYEVHISNIAAREPYRRRSLVSGVARGTIAGLGVRGYLLALEAAIEEETR